MATTATIGLSEAKAKFSKLATQVNETGQSVTIFKNNNPFVVLTPVSKEPSQETLAAMRESEAMSKDPSTKTYLRAEDLFAEMGI